MKRLISILFPIIVLLGLVVLSWINRVPSSTLQVAPLTRFDKKHIPSDEFFMQRAFPDAAFSMQTYTAALQSIKKNIQAQPRNSFEHFDRDWTVEGPGNLGGRVNTVAYHPENTNIILAGYASGGLFRTENGGADWIPVFDEQLFLAIGDIAFDPNNPNIVYAGTGDPNISGFPFLGDGLYKSEDAGMTWRYIGLRDTRIISKIIIHPTNSNQLFVATMGLPFEPTKDRGLYRSINGGESWEKVLFLGEETGVIDVVFDSQDPNILFAAGWDRMRNSKVSKSFGPGAKIHRSMDGGSTWEQLDHILPQDEQSRIGLASSQGVVFATYVDTSHNHENLYRSYDKGTSWEIVHTSRSVAEALQGFGWYFGQVRVNPNNRDDITILGVASYRTKTGGSHWEVLTQYGALVPHVDHHDLVYHPSGKMLLATDGGLYESNDSGRNWMDIENIPTSQTYRVAYNPHLPDYYYGGFQDNGSAAGHAEKINNWEQYNRGDGFKTVFHPTEPQIFYSQYQRGGIEVTRNGGDSWMPAISGIVPSDRKGWDTPYIISPHNPNILYTGTHRMYKSTSGIIPSWKIISEDLTDGPIYDREQSISAIDQSPLFNKTLYAGTMDANVWKSEDEGTTWEQIQKGLPERAVTDIIASEDTENTVFVTYSGYKDNDFSPHIFRSDDRGANWYSVVGNLPPLAINALVVPKGYNHEILFAATDGGVYGSLDGGDQWERLGNNMPVIAVYDLIWNTGINTLVAGTFARSILSYPLEDIVEPPFNTISSVKDLLSKEKPLLVFPNPAQHQLNLSFSNPTPNQPVQIDLYTLNGQSVLSFNIRTSPAATLQQDISQLPAGIYFITVQGERFYLSDQFVKIE